LLTCFIVFAFISSTAKGDQTAYSNYCRDSASQNNLPDLYCWVGYQFFDTSPSPTPNTLPTTGSLSSIKLLVHNRNSTAQQVGSASTFHLKKGAAIYCYLPASDESIPADANWHMATFQLANAYRGDNEQPDSSQCAINFGAGDRLQEVYLNTYILDFAWTDHNIYTDGVSVQQNSFFSADHSLWFETNVKSPACNPPTSMLINVSGTAGFSDATLLNQRVSQCGLMGNLTIENSLPVWLGVRVISTPPGVATLSADLSTGLPGEAASFSLVPPCSTNLVQCTSPGLAAWTADFSARGAVEIELGISGEGCRCNRC
jgi:hypothetical protein